MQSLNSRPSSLQAFIDSCCACAARRPEPADAVMAIAPHMHALLNEADSFLNPDHIHVTGVPADAPPVVSLHLYGRNMDSFHVYDLATRSRTRIQVPHNES